MVAQIFIFPNIVRKKNHEVKNSKKKKRLDFLRFPLIYLVNLLKDVFLLQWVDVNEWLVAATNWWCHYRSKEVYNEKSEEKKKNKPQE